MTDQTTQTIPKGYKKIEVSIIPVDWDAFPISLLTSEVGDGIHSTPIYSNYGDYFFVNGNNLVNGKIVITQDTKRADFSEFKKHKKNLGDRTIFLSINGTIGNLALYSGEPIILGKSAAYLNVREKISKRYIYFSLQTESVKRFFEKGLTGTTIKNLGLGTIRKTLIALPKDKKEQTTIATALCDVDALIQSLEKLIAKKRTIKQGAMQALLTGKRRMPGFGGEREVMKLRDVCSLEKGVQINKSKLTETGKYPVFNGGREPSGYTEQWNTIENTITISEGGNSCGYVNYSAHKFWCGGHCYAVQRIEKSINHNFLYHQLKFNESEIMHLRVGSGLPNIQKKNLLNFHLNTPKKIEEQAAIAKVLDEMDMEIERLKQKILKYKMLKQGMMQVLLTGKVRLV